MLKRISWSQVHFFLMVPLLALIAFMLNQTVWPLYPIETHWFMELLSVIMGSMIFVLIWFSYDKVPESYRLLGFSYLIIALLYAVHASLYPGYNAAEEDFYLDLVIIASLIEALAFFSLTFNIPFRLNKLATLFIALLIGGVILEAVAIFHPFLPVLYNATGFTQAKSSLEVVILLILLINIYFLSKKSHTGDLIAYNLIFSAILIDLLLTTFFLFQKEPNTTWSILGHILRIAFNFHLFKAIFVSTITYPYEKLEEVLNHLPLAVVTYDHNQRLTFANKKAEKITGLYYAEVKGFAQQQIVAKMFNYQVPSDIETDLAIIGEVSQKIVTIKNQQDDVVKLVADTYRLQSGGYLCIFDTANKVQEIQNLRFQTQTILNSLNNFVIILDVNHTVITCNKALCDTLEMSTEEIVGLSIYELNRILSFSRPNLIQNITDSSLLNTPIEASIVTPAGKTKDCLLQLAQIKNVDGEVIGIISVGSDITNLKKEQAEAQQQEKLALLGQMATGIVHEIRNPITAMMGFIQILNRKLQDEKLREYCQHMEKEALDLNRIVSDFLQFARPRPAVFKPASTNSIIEGLQLMIDTNLFSKGIQVQYYLQPNLPLIIADGNKIKQVILNIVKNAVDAVKDVENPQIKISTGYTPAIKGTYIAITNNGTVISPDVIEKIATPFFTTKTKGTGLGLSICNQIVSEHKGRITITSDAVFGTTVEMVFPELEPAI